MLLTTAENFNITVAPCNENVEFISELVAEWPQAGLLWLWTMKWC